MLEINNLQAGVEGRNILKGINLTVNAGEVHAIMGPNGSGKRVHSPMCLPAGRVTISVLIKYPMRGTICLNSAQRSVCVKVSFSLFSIRLKSPV